MTNEERAEWVKTLKVGDRVVALSGSTWAADKRPRGIVTAVTSTGFVKVKIYSNTPNVFTRDGKSKVGRGWHSYYWTLDPWTPEDQAQLEKDTADAQAAQLAHEAEEARLNALPPLPGRVGAAVVKELERDLENAREDLRKAADAVKDRAERVIALLSAGVRETTGRSGLNGLGELQTLVSAFEGGCKHVSELEGIVQAVRVHLLPKKED
jgi:hypothetical protein